MSKSLSQFKALIFDVYGTLDWESGILAALSPILTPLDQEWSRSNVLLAFSAVESNLQTKNPAALYSDILAAAYDELSRRSARRGLLNATAPADSAITGIEGSESGAETHSHASQQSPAASTPAKSRCRA